MGRPPHLLETADQWFWPNVDRSGGPDACWPWTGRLDDKGYGRIWVLGKQQRCHRIAFRLVHGHYPVGLGCHSCNFRPCCNDAHIYDGTHLTNTADRRAAGISTSRTGEANHNAKLTWETATVIRTSREMSSVLSHRYGVSTTVIRMVRSGRAWRVSEQATGRVT